MLDKAMSKVEIALRCAEAMRIHEWQNNDYSDGGPFYRDPCNYFGEYVDHKFTPVEGYDDECLCGSPECDHEAT